MFELILYNLSSSSLLIVIFLVTFFIVGLTTYWLINKVRLKKGKIKLYGLLLKISDKDTFTLSIIVVRTFLIIYCTLLYQNNVNTSLIMIAIISIIYIMFSFKNIIYEVINTLSIMAVIYFINTLNNYIMQVSNSSSVQIIKTVLIAFTIMYSIYLLLRGVEDIVANNANIND